MRRHDLWRLEYGQDPYLEVLDTPHLMERFIEVMGNGIFLTDELKIGMISIASGGGYWMASSTHLFAEFGKRGGIPGGMNRDAIPKFDWPGMRSAIRPFADSKAAHPGVIVKYGKSEDLRELYDSGRLVIRPASSYNDASLNRAVRDDELELKVYRKSWVFDKLYDEFGQVLHPNGPKHGRRVEILRTPTNYFVYCMSLERSVRLFGDFQSDCCIIIHEPVAFLRRLGAAGLRTLGNRWSWFAAPIAYIDPLRPPNSHLNIMQCKDFKYAYQAEYRMVWLPPKPSFSLEPFVADLGSLAPIASFVQLEASSAQAGAADLG